MLHHGKFKFETLFMELINMLEDTPIVKNMGRKSLFYIIYNAVFQFCSINLY